MLCNKNELKFNNRALLEARGFYEELQLPIPKEGEFHRTYDQGGLSLITHYGCSIRITPVDKYPNVPHRRFLRPIFSRIDGMFHMAINPGVCLDVKCSDILKFKKTLHKEGVEVLPYEVRNGNLGKLPEPYNQSTVIIDPGAITGVCNNDLVNKAIKNKDAQGKVFKELRDGFEQAWPEGAEKSNIILMKEAWNRCATAKEKGLLAAPWSLHINDHAGTYLQSERYTKAVVNYQKRVFF